MNIDEYKILKRLEKINLDEIDIDKQRKILRNKKKNINKLKEELLNKLKELK